MTEYLVQGFEDFHQKDQTDRNGTEGDEVSKGVKRQM